MDKNILNTLQKLNTLNKERIFWLKFSVILVIISLVTLIKWDYLIHTNLIWYLAGLGIIVTVIWWYWTMNIIRKLIGFKTIETTLLGELITDIRDIKKNITKNNSQHY